MLKGKAKFIREDGIYKAFVRNFFWQRWRPLCSVDGKQIEFDSFAQLSELTRIDCFDEVTMKYHNFGGYR